MSNAAEQRGAERRFCPYCGKPISERAKFCPSCGKASPARKRAGSVVVEEAGAAASRGEGASRSVAAGASGPSTTGAAERRQQLRPATDSPFVRSNNGAAAPHVRRYAPATHSLFGAFEQAGFGLRYGALMFDFLITLIAIMSFTFIVTWARKESVLGSNRDLVIVAVLTLLLVIGNFVVLAGSNGQSAGMRILGIRIIRVDGQPFTMKHAAVRHFLGYPLSMLAFSLGFLWMLWDPRQQGWHDKLARTIVVVSP